MSDLNIHTKIETLSTELRNEVNNFVDSLLQKSDNSKGKIAPKFGSAEGKIEMSADFDEPLDDFKDYM
jgi:hypothetical protein